MRIGDFEITTPNVGMFRLDGGAMFGAVPKTLWSKAIPADELNRIPMALRLILLKDLKRGRILLVDTGIGHKSSAKFEEIYAVDYSRFSLDRALIDANLKPEDITDVVLTHLHFDHTGGSTRRDAGGEIVPTFPKAKYYIQKQNFDWATKPNSREAASYLGENFLPLCQTHQLVICDGPEELARELKWPGFSVRVSNGHTIGLQCPLIEIENQKFFYPSDLIPTSAHVPLPWVMGYDIQIIKILDEKEAILKEAASEGWIFIYEHDPVIAASRIVKGSKHYEKAEAVNF